jgi:hypothetical protein
MAITRTSSRFSLSHNAIICTYYLLLLENFLIFFVHHVLYDTPLPPGALLKGSSGWPIPPADTAVVSARSSACIRYIVGPCKYMLLKGQQRDAICYHSSI